MQQVFVVNNHQLSDKRENLSVDKFDLKKKNIDQIGGIEQFFQ